MTRRAARRAARDRVLFVAAIVASVFGLALVSAGGASAAFLRIPEMGMPGRVVLSSDPYPLTFHNLLPGTTVYAQVLVEVRDVAVAAADIEVRKDGPLAQHPHGLEMDVSGCAVEWIQVPQGVGPAGNPVCPGEHRDMVDSDPDDHYETDSPEWSLGMVTPADRRYLLLRLSLPADAAGDTSVYALPASFSIIVEAEAPDGTTLPQVSVSLTEEGEDATAGGSALANTGVNAAGWALLAGGLLVLGLRLVVRRRDRTAARR